MLCSRATIGEIRIAATKVCTNQGFKSLVCKHGVDNEFIYYLLLTLKSKLIERASGSTFLEIGKKDVTAILIPLPPLFEQCAIARVLSDVDGLLEALDKLIEKKRALKTAAMQQLLTGKKRLPGFEGPWVKRRLGEVAEIKKGELITEATAKEGTVPVVGGGISVSYYHNVSNRPPHTITISASGANAGYVSYHDYPIFASDCSTIGPSNTYDVKFLFYLLKNNQNLLTSLQTGGAQPHVYPEYLKPLTFLFPEIPEQRAIARVLSDTDAEIEALEARREKVRQLKQGMMQVLLTGKVRLVGEKTDGSPSQKK